jgi:hypothetical protein
MVLSSLSFNHHASNLEKMRKDNRLSGIKAVPSDLEDGDFKFDLPSTPVEIEPNNTRVVGGLFPGKGFFYLPKTTCFDKELDEQIYTMEVLQSTLMTDGHSQPIRENYAQMRSEAKSPARYMMESLD